MGCGPAAGRIIILVPKAAVTQLGGKPGVWVVNARTATLRPITPGQERVDQIEVKSGLAPGEAVILNPPSGLTDGMRVKPK